MHIWSIFFCALIIGGLNVDTASLEQRKKEDSPGEPVKSESRIGRVVKKLDDKESHANIQESQPRKHVSSDNGDVPRKPRRRFRNILTNSEACSYDIKNLCPKESQTHNFMVLDCLERDDATAEKVSEACQHFVWQFKRNVTLSPIFKVASQRVCMNDFQNITDCSGLGNDGQKIACYYEYKNRIRNPECLMFMNRIGTILFSDYHLIYKFAESCGNDIQRLSCGRISGRVDSDEKKSQLPSSQGKTIECLLDDVDKLKPQCAHEIMRVAELQADDYHLDRPLFFACRGDREKLCPKVTSGEGRVYKCLMKQSQNPMMSSECLNHLTKRMQLREKSFKVDYSFAGACSDDMQKAACLSEQQLAQLQQQGTRGASIALSTVILCLENAVKTSTHQVTPECMSEMFEVRKQLMSDYKISPEIVLHCDQPIQKCGHGIQRNGVTLHCLMDQLKGKIGQPGMEEYPKCKDALMRLVRVADPGTDYRVDPTIMRACGSIIRSGCHEEAQASPTTGAVLSCLMDRMESAEMPEQCSEKLMELQYLLSRDFRLDQNLFVRCRSDAKRVCHAPNYWNNSKTGGLIFSCLYRNMAKKEDVQEKNGDDDDDDDDTPHRDGPGKSIPKEEQLSASCSAEVLRVLRERSKRVMLNPYVYDNCLTDLSRFCTHGTAKNQEIRCLQQNFEKLSDTCRPVVRKFTAEQDRHPSLDYIMAAACRPMITKFCLQEMRSDPGLIMPCLIKHKDHDEMNVKCRAGVEHHQIISLKDHRISRAFRRSCSSDLNRYCRDVTTKTQAVTCLSEVVRNATLTDKEVPLSKGCRQQVRFENFQKSQDIRLSPRLADACKQDLEAHCGGVPPERQVRCLRSQRWASLTSRCQRLLFRRVQLESLDSRIDARLQRVCKPMIKHYCAHEEKRSLDCLWRNIHDEDFDPKCRRVVYLRLETRAKDYRLDPLIMQLCKRDIRKFCSQLLDPHANLTGTQYRGRVTACLKKRFRSYELTTGCQGHIRQLVRESNMNHHLDPILRRACEKDVQRTCATELEEEGHDDGRITECLKKALSKGRIQSPECQKETLRLMEEGRADIHVDPVLYQACQHELSTLCHNVPLGNGKQMACLLWAKDDREARKGMSHTCRQQVQSRVEMWEAAAKLAPPESLHELAVQISTSSAKNYFFAFLATVVLFIFVFGLCCGRVTKRVPVSAKNK